MPFHPARPCSTPGCQYLQPCPVHVRPSVLPFKRDKERQKLYDRRWQKRRVAQLARQPWCEDCLEMQPPIYTPATEAHHEQRHEGDRLTFIRSPLRSLCKAHHSSRTLQEIKAKKQRAR